MQDKKKIGLLLALGTNYGALLQSYATQQVAINMGFVSFVINKYNGGRRDILRHGATGIMFYIMQHLNNDYNTRPKQKLDALHKENKKKRAIAQQSFIKERFVNVMDFSDHTELVQFASSLDVVMIGSDQSWLPGSMIGIKASMEFVPKGVRRVSYATSLGVSEYPKYSWKQARNVWKRMDFISVREEQGKKIIQDICGDIPVQVVCDPTYLLTKKEWEERIPVKRLEVEKYILCYFLGTDKKLFEIARKFADERNLKLLSILSCEVAVNGDDIFADRLIIGASPEEFVNFIRGAEFILTDSFHGVAFSVINEKQFFLFYPQRDYLSQSRNSRLDNIVKMWGLEDRLIVNKERALEDESSRTQIDYKKVTSRVLSKRKESLEYLNKALKFDD